MNSIGKLLTVLIVTITLEGVRASVITKGAHRETPKIRGKSGKVYIVYPKAIPPPPGPTGAKAVKASGSTKKAVTSTVAPVPLWLVWESVDSVMLEWERNPETNIVGYRVYSGMEARLYSKVSEAGTNTTMVMPVVLGTNYFTVTAHNRAGREGAYAPEVHHVRSETPQLRAGIVRKPPASNPSGVFEIQTKAELDKSWVPVGSVTNRFPTVTELDHSFGKPYQFWRVGVKP